MRKRFVEYAKSRAYETNDRFYLIDDELWVDYVIRYEALEEGLAEVCTRVGLSSLQIPRLKTGIRKGKRPYTDYYDDEARDAVAEMHRYDIRLFGYCFGA